MKQSELKTLDTEIIRLATNFGPIGVRGLYYQAVCAGVMEKTDKGYDLLQRRLAMLRMGGQVDWDLITDCSRNVQSVSTWNSMEDIITSAKKQFKMDTWITQPCRVQLWLEKEGLAPLLEDIITKYRVPLYPGKGYSSLSFTRQAALQAIDWLDAGQRVIVLQWGDYDPSGVNIQESLANQYKQFGAGECEMVRVGINSNHIDEYNLITRPTKTTDTRSKSFGDTRSVELDAIPPDTFKKWVSNEIEKYINFPLWNEALAKEEAERNN